MSFPDRRLIIEPKEQSDFLTFQELDFSLYYEHDSIGVMLDITNSGHGRQIGNRQYLPKDIDAMGPVVNVFIKEGASEKDLSIGYAYIWFMLLANGFGHEGGLQDNLRKTDVQDLAVMIDVPSEVLLQGMRVFLEQHKMTFEFDGLQKTIGELES